MKTGIKLTWSILLAVLFIQLNGCQDDEGTTPTDSEESVGVNLSSNANLGSVLTDNDGRTLYVFTKDFKGTSACVDDCLQTWPVFYAENLEIGTGLSQSDFGTITRGDGGLQTTYKGWPLYYYTPSGSTEAAGAVGGEAVGNVWFVAKPDYTIMLANGQLVGHDGKNYTSNYTEGTGETQFMVDGEGRTIYIFSNDRRNTNNFTAEDLSNNSVWPIFYEDLQSVPSILNNSDFGSITVHGQQQLTYRGWPLYYFGQDSQRGQNKGVSFPSAGVWPIVSSSTESAEQ